MFCSVLFYEMKEDTNYYENSFFNDSTDRAFSAYRRLFRRFAGHDCDAQLFGVLRHYNAREVDAQSAPALYKMVQELARRGNLPMPKVYIIDSPVPNAFATGRNPEHAAVAVTTALYDVLDKREIAGVLGHELSHVKHNDILISTIAATMAGIITTIAQWGMATATTRATTAATLSLLC